MKTVSAGILGSIAFSAAQPGSSARSLPDEPGPLAPDDEHAWERIREMFPLTRNRVYFNTGTMGPSPSVVLDTVKNALQTVDVSGEYGGGEVARPAIAKFVNVDEAEISITHNTTEGINVIAGGLPLKRGDEVILTTHEHVGNALPWLNRMKLDGIVIKVLKPAATSADNLNRLSDLISTNTRVIAIPHITCTTGLIFPVKEIARLGHDKGLWVFFDGAHGAGMTDLDLREMGCDFYASCGHKWMCGPKGTGFLYVKKDLLDVVQTRWLGGYSDLGWDVTVDPPEFKGYVPTAHRYDFATQNSALQIGLAASTDFLGKVGIHNIVKRGNHLAALLQGELLKLGDGIEMLTPVEESSRGSIVGFRLKKIQYDKFGGHAAKRGFRVRLVAESHLNSVRISTHIYNSADDVMRFIDAVKEVV